MCLQLEINKMHWLGKRFHENIIFNFKNLKVDEELFTLVAKADDHENALP